MNEKTKRKGASVHSRLKRAITKGDVTTMAELYCHYYIDADYLPDDEEKLTDGDTWNIGGALDTPEKYSKFSEHVVFFYTLREAIFLIGGCYYMYEDTICSLIGLCAKYLHLKAKMESEQNAEARAELQTAMDAIDFKYSAGRVEFARVQYSSIVRGIVETYEKSCNLWRFIPDTLKGDFENYKNKTDHAMNVAQYMTSGDDDLKALFTEKLEGVPSLWDVEFNKGYMNTAVKTMNIYEAGWRKKTE